MCTVTNKFIIKFIKTDSKMPNIYLKLAVAFSPVANTSVMLFHFLMDFFKDNSNPESTNVYSHK